MSKLTLGCIADDFTGATDLCNTLVKGGMRTVQLIGVPAEDVVTPDTDAVVIALKSRTCPAEDAVAESLAALDWLRAAGARQYVFKYCSTFDSTDAGNIGPVADALLDALGEDLAIVCPAFPEAGRTIYRGHLFVGDQLLSDSPMKDHPLTPMTDSNLVRVMGRQTSHRVGLVPLDVVSQGAAAISGALATLRQGGVRYAVVDVVEDGDLLAIGAACAEIALVTGGSGVAMGLPENFRQAGLLQDDAVAAYPAVDGSAAVLSGSCSAATQRQVATMAAHGAAFAIDPLALADEQDVVGEALTWATARLADGPPLIYATAAPESVRAVQDRLGRERAGALVEEAMAAIARGLAAAGVRRFVVAGGETSGAVVKALGVLGLRIGPQIDPGVPWTTSLGEPAYALALKSGNFGSDDFFTKALALLR